MSKSETEFTCREDSQHYWPRVYVKGFLSDVFRVRRESWALVLPKKEMDGGDGVPPTDHSVSVTVTW